MSNLFLETFRIAGETVECETRIAKQAGITRARWHILQLLEKTQHPLTVSQVARRMGLSRQGVQRVVNDLVTGQFLETLPNPDHKRSVLLRLTPQGMHLHQRVQALYSEWIDHASRNVNEPAIEKTLEVIKLVREQLS